MMLFEGGARLAGSAALPAVALLLRLKIKAIIRMQKLKPNKHIDFQFLNQFKVIFILLK